MFLLTLLASEALAVPLQMTQQGRIVDSDGAPYEGLHTLAFQIYDEETGGNVVWLEVQTITLTNGYYAAVLGADEQGNPLDESVLSLYPLYLQLTVDGGAPLDRQSIHFLTHTDGTSR